jgi:release factor glutamine methyltransferase
MNAMSTLTVAQALLQAHSHGVERLDAQLMLCAIVQQGRTWLQTHDDAVLPGAQAAQWAEWLARRAAGEPLAYLLGEKEFHGLALQVSPDVLVPRPDTETLVDWALDLLRAMETGGEKRQPRVIDLGCGSGAVALAIKRSHPSADVSAVDTSTAALRVAQANASRLALDVAFHPSDWWTALAGRRFALAVSNPPYIAEGDPHLDALGHEPRLALTSGPDGFDALRHLIEHAPAHLEPGAWLLLEHGNTQATGVRALLQKQGFACVATRRDLGGNERCTGGRWMMDHALIGPIEPPIHPS